MAAADEYAGVLAEEFMKANDTRTRSKAKTEGDAKETLGQQETSTTDQRLETSAATQMKEIFDKHNLLQKKAFLQARKDYKDAQKLEKARQTQLTSLSKHQEDAVLLQLVLTNYKAAISAVVAKVIACLNKHNTYPHTIVKNRLHESIQLLLTDERIINPFKSGNLSGILAHLSTYNTATMSSFTTYLGEALQSYKHPSKLTQQPMALVRNYFFWSRESLCSLRPAKSNYNSYFLRIEDLV